MIKIATIDLYNNERNEGMRCIKEIVSEVKSRNNDAEISYEVFDTRFKDEVPGLDKRYLHFFRRTGKSIRR
ncbi:MAG: hypothetical protein U5J96_19110 [Ignavibacteriaceae bacterium]|nr:hypothetical protein [Ignavibacteriaceae bacterium]